MEVSQPSEPVDPQRAVFPSHGEAQPVRPFVISSGSPGELEYGLGKVESVLHVSQGSRAVARVSQTYSGLRTNVEATSTP